MGLYLKWKRHFHTIHNVSYLVFSGFPPPNCLLMNLARFLSIISSADRPSLPFSTAFFEAVCEAALVWSPPETPENRWKRKNGHTNKLITTESATYSQLTRLSQFSPSFLAFLLFLPPCSLFLSPSFVSIIDFTVFWDFWDMSKVLIVTGALALLLSSASLQKL